MAGESVAERLLRQSDSQTLRVFAASCAERLLPVFGTLRAGDPGRADDIALLVDTLEELWGQSVASALLASQLEKISALRELQPTEVGLRLVADIYAFYAVLVFMHAAETASNNDRQAAAECAHASLTAMGQLDANVPGSAFYEEELNRQSAVLEMLKGRVTIATMRAEDQSIARRRVAAIVARLS